MHKQKTSMKSLSNLNPYVKKYRLPLIIALLLAFLGAIFSLIGPNKLSEITNLITDSFKQFMKPGFDGSINIQAINHIAIFLVILYVLGAIFNYTQGVIMAVVTQKITKQLRTDLEHKMNRLPLKFYDQTNNGDILSRMTNDIDMVGQTLNQSLGTLVTAVSLFIGSLIMMIYTNLLMTLAAIVATIIGFVLIGLIMGKSQKYFKQQQKNLGKLNAYAEETYNGHQIVKVFNNEDNAISEFETINNQLYKSSRKATYLAGLMMPLMRFVGNLGYVAVCVVGAHLCFNNKIEFGVIVAFMLYIRLFTQPLSQIAQVFNSLQQTAAASDRIFEFLNEDEMPNDDNLLQHFPEKLQGSIKLQNVSFSYNEDKEILHNLNLEVKPKQTVAIVGPTGSGKTTIVNLLMKFYDLTQGEIYLDDWKISQLSRKLVHQQFCMVLQDTWLFDGTILENIIYNRKNISEDNVREICKAVGVDHFIQTLPNGYHTHITEAMNLSQGQRQLITIARAAVSQTPFLILDEATSSVDTRTELVVQEAMDHLMKDRTSFVIAHRLSTIKDADMIVVLKDGKIIETGKHDDLLEQQGFYAKLYNSQFE